MIALGLVSPRWTRPRRLQTSRRPGRDPKIVGLSRERRQVSWLRCR